MNCVTYLVSVNIKYLGTIPLGGYLLTSTCWSNTFSDMQYYTAEGSMALMNGLCLALEMLWGC